MALSTTQDYQTAINKILHVIENSVGLTWPDFVRFGGLAQADVNTLKNSYRVYKSSLAFRLHDPSAATRTPLHEAETEEFGGTPGEVHPTL